MDWMGWKFHEDADRWVGTSWTHGKEISRRDFSEN